MYICIVIDTAIDYKGKYEELSLEFFKLKHELDQLKKLVFGSKHERFVPATSPEQLALELDVETNLTAAPIIEEVSYTRTKPSSQNSKVPSGRMALPASLPRERVVFEPAEDVTGLKKIGEEITEELEVTEMRFFVRQLVRPKYAKKNGEGIIIGTLPSRPIDKGIAGPGLLTTLIIGKFVDHLPIYRQVEIFKRSGITLASSTISDWIEATCRLLEPLYERHRKKILESHYLQVDETPLKVLDKNKKGTTHRGYHWVYHAPEEGLVLFDYREGRGREGPQELLKNFKGYLQTDGYEIYERFAKKEGITHLHCMAHARRKFDEAISNDSSRASYVLIELQKLYAIEFKIREADMCKEQALSLRKQESVPVLNGLKQYFIENYKVVVPQSPIGKAISYALQRWDKLCIYTKEALLKIDSNLVENAIRPVAIGRKNYLFAGSHKGAERAAILYSFMATCKKNNIMPNEWLKNVLERLPDHPMNKLDELLPSQWTPTGEQK